MSSKMENNWRGWGKPFLRASLCSKWGFTLPEHSHSPSFLGTEPLGLIRQYLTNSSAWGIAIMVNFVFSPSCSAPGLPHGAPLHQILPGRMSVHGNLFFSWSLSFPCLPDILFHQLFPVGCSSVGNPPPGYFPFWVPILTSCDPLPYLFPLCMHLHIVNIFNFVMDCESCNQKNCK